MWLDVNDLHDQQKHIASKSASTYTEEYSSEWLRTSMDLQAIPKWQHPESRQMDVS